MIYIGVLICISPMIVNADHLISFGNLYAFFEIDFFSSLPPICLGWFFCFVCVVLFISCISNLNSMNSGKYPISVYRVSFYSGHYFLISKKFINLILSHLFVSSFLTSSSNSLNAYLQCHEVFCLCFSQCNLWAQV